MKIPREVLLVAQHLGALRDQVVFVGGMMRGLLVTDPAVSGPRPTKDVDVIMQIRSAVHRTEFDAQVRALGFKEDTADDAPICRYLLRGLGQDGTDIPVDFMPLDPSILGFSNVWYPDAFDSAEELNTESGLIHSISAVYFVATKLEAFAGRGEGNYYHHDLEDVVVVIDGRPSFSAELDAAPADSRQFIAEEISFLLEDPSFLESLPGHLPPDDASQGRLPLLLRRLHDLAAKAVRAPASPHHEGRSQPSARIAETHPTFASPDAALSWTPRRSSNIDRFSYDPSSRVLEVTFHQGGVYQYYEVPFQVFAGWKVAASAGRYHHRWIRDRYHHRRVSR